MAMQKCMALITSTIILESTNFKIEWGIILSLFAECEGLKRMVTNNVDFSVMYNPVEKKKIHELIEPEIKISLLIDHIIKYKEASPNPMINRRNSKFVKEMEILYRRQSK